MIRHHPTIGEVNILMKLNCDHLGIDLDDHAFQPIACPFSIIVMVTINLDNIANLIIAIVIRRG